MADRYIVTTIAEARASGKRAAGFAFRADAEAVCASLNRGRDPIVVWQNESAYDECICAILDTHTAADGSPIVAPAGAGEGRRPAEGWVTVNRGTPDERHRIDLVLLNPNAPGAFSKREAMTLSLEPYGEQDDGGPDGHLVSLRVGNGWLPDIEDARDTDAAKIAAESAASSLLVAALCSLPNARAVLVEALGKLEGK